MKCTLTLGEVPLHLYQVIAGFEQLARAGKIELTFRTLSPRDSETLPYNVLAADCGGQTLLFDMNDGYDNLPESSEDYVAFYNALLARCDRLYKRSFHEGMNARLRQPEKVWRTPPNFFVTIPTSRAHLPVPCDPAKEKLKKLVRLLPVSPYYNGYGYEPRFERQPCVRREPRALFMARLWDPQGEFSGQLSEEKAQERFEINQCRTACMRACRRAFGDRFFGGVADSGFARREYPDLIVKDKLDTRKDRYLKKMIDFDILIATSGLHKSTGWKFAEYLAASKAVVTEPLFYESVGTLSEGQNYLSFRDEHECCERIDQLFEDEKRHAMMCANRDYYQTTMRCEAYIAAAMGLE